MGRVLTPEELKEYENLWDQHSRASAIACAMLRTYGMESKQFREADAETGRLCQRLREVQGLRSMR